MSILSAVAKSVIKMYSLPTLTSIIRVCLVRLQDFSYELDQLYMFTFLTKPWLRDKQEHNNGED